MIVTNDTSKASTMAAAAKQRRAPSMRETWTASVLVSTFVFAVLFLFWAIFIHRYYFPISDDISLIVNSTLPFDPSISSWFFQGFKNYFDTYPDLFFPISNFVRPGVNAIFYLDYIAFHSHWSLYFLSTYGFVAIIGGLTYYIAARLLAVGRRLALVTALCAAFAPSLATWAFFSPAFAFDLLASVYILAGVVAFLGDSMTVAWICFAAAVFTKETALFAPCLAAVILWIRMSDRSAPRRYLVGAAFLIPVIAWGLLYAYDFREERGVYVLHSGIPAIRVVLDRFLHWPIEGVDRIAYWYSPHALLKAVYAVSAALNALTWVAALVAVSYGIVRYTKWRGRVAGGNFRVGARSAICNSKILIVAIFCVGSLLMPLFLGLPNRFGGIFYPLFALWMAYELHRRRSLWIRWYSILILAGIGVVGSALICSNILYNLQSFQKTWAMSRSYIGILSKSKSPRVFVFDDVAGGYTSIESIRRFSGYHGSVVKLNDLLWNFECPNHVQEAMQEGSDGSWKLTSIVPGKCGSHWLNGVLLSPPTKPVVSFKRNIADATLQYHWLPDGGRIFTSSVNVVFTSSRADDLDILLRTDASGGAILLPDFETNTYREIQMDGDSGMAAGPRR